MIETFNPNQVPAWLQEHRRAALRTDEQSDDEVIRAIRSVPRHKSESQYLVYNSSLATTAAPVKQPTGTAIRTMLQLKQGAMGGMRVIEWGCSFDGSAAATPGQVELFETTVAATMSTAYVAADIQPYGGNLTANASNIPIDVTGTSTAGFATAAVTEGTVANYRGFDLQLLPPTAPYVKQFPLGREPDWKAGNFLRVRVTFGTTINMYCYILFGT
jgi:hypothetical protein